MSDEDPIAHEEREAQLTFLLRELNHRVRNVLATIQALVDTMAASTSSPQECAAALKVRISALADIHEAIWRGELGQVEAVQMVRMALGPHALSEEQLEIDDGECTLPGRVATPLFMALNELAINARKHGALSVPEGRIHVGAYVDADGQVLEILWRETGGPPVRPADRRGFGMTIIEHGLEYEAGGRAELDFGEEGLTARLSVPLDGRDV